MCKCKACGRDFASTDQTEEICYVCIGALKRLNGYAVPVVRCKDCKYRVKSRWHDGYQCGNECDGMASGVELKDDDFCSYGERQDNA